MAVDKEALLSALDESAVHLLNSARATTTEDGKPVPHTLAEQVKAFQAVASYLEVREGLVPKQKVEAAFDGLRAQFHGQKADGRRNRRSKAAETDADAGFGNADGAALFS